MRCRRPIPFPNYLITHTGYARVVELLRAAPAAIAAAVDQHKIEITCRISLLPGWLGRRRVFDL
jgi:hypothetical protein